MFNKLSVKIAAILILVMIVIMSFFTVYFVRSRSAVMEEELLSKGRIEALAGVDNTFKRTPKFDLRTHADQWWQKRYSLPRDPIVLAEILAATLALVFYVVGNLEFAGRVSQWLLIYAVGYGYVGGLSVWQSTGGRAFRPRLD